MQQSDAHYDAVIVGGRCAGSATAINLGRAGYQVLLVERAAMPSDTLSTHVLWPDGIAALRRLGLLDAVLATGAPPAHHFRLVRGDDEVLTEIVPFDGIDYTLCVRRLELDGILWDAASATEGVDAHDRTSALRLRRDGDRVIGVDLRGPTGERSVSADIVIGADGRNSHIAHEVGATERNVVEPGRYWYYTYFRDAAPPGPIALTQSDAERDMIATMPMNDGLQMVILGAYNEDFDEFRRDHEANYFARINAHQWVRQMLAKATPVAPVRGIAGVRGYDRTVWGSGWALIGDAVHQKNPIVARGINEALREAEFLGNAFADGISDAALTRYADAVHRHTLGKALNARMLERPDRWMTADQGALLSAATTTPDGLARYLRVEYDDTYGFAEFFGDAAG
ncbi:MAG: FAD-dependent monooxygenase [Thermomicrobiales bacterium]|nr:FAD-dependent monooxygenase [Thermomicrobiales bacterium]